MPKIEVCEVGSIQDFVGCVLDRHSPAVPTWYRGSGDRADKLRPLLYRNDAEDLPAIIAKERDLLAKFRQRSLPYLARDLVDDDDNLLFMQHYRIPTRLLDWTENPLVALFFALTDSRAAQIARSAVWLLRPVLWNRRFLKDIKEEPRVLSAKEDILKPYWDVTAKNFRDWPLALHGAHNSVRLAAQKGTFVLFPQTSKDPMEAWIARDNGKEFDRGTLVRIEIPPEAVVGMREALFALGITEATVYPDLEGLAKELSRESGTGGGAS